MNSAMVHALGISSHRPPLLVVYVSLAETVRFELTVLVTGRLVSSEVL